MGQNLLPSEIIAKIPKFKTTSNQADPICWVRLHFKFYDWEWFIVEYNEETDEAFGFVKGMENEIGYFSVKELREIKEPTPVKRDKKFKPTKLSMIIEKSD